MTAHLYRPNRTAGVTADVDERRTLDAIARMFARELEIGRAGIAALHELDAERRNDADSMMTEGDSYVSTTTTGSIRTCSPHSQRTGCMDGDFGDTEWADEGEGSSPVEGVSSPIVG